MKNARIAIGLVMMCLLVVPAFSRVTIISEQHRVYGHARAGWYGGLWFNEYDITSNEPLDHAGYGEAYLAPSPDDPIISIYTSTKAGNFSIETSGLGTDTAHMTSGASSMYELLFNTTRIEIHLSVLFAPYYDVTYEGGSYSFAGPNVHDSLSWDQSDLYGGWWGVFDYDGTFVYNNITPGEVYTLQIASDIVTKWPGEGSQITVDIFPHIIPAPSAIVLAGIGMSMVGWLRRRQVV